MKALLRRQLVFLSAVLALVLSPCSPLWADPDAKADRTFRVTETVAGKTYPEWTRNWFQWAFGVKKDRNPITDQTGEFAGEGQMGPVWFLAGSFGGTIVRKLDVPADKALFVPVLSTLGRVPPGGDEKDLQAGATKRMDKATDLEVILDDQPIEDVKQYRVATGSFVLKCPGKEEAVVPVLAGDKTVVAEGYWVLLKPLAKGGHTLRVKSKLGGGAKEKQFEMDVTYHLNVKGE